MISQTTTHIYLGPRPIGLHELVNRQDGTVTFVTSQPTGCSPLDLVINPNEVSFSCRPRDFLTALRNERLRVLEEHRKSRNSQRAPKEKGTKNVSGTTTRKPPKPKELSSLTGALKGIDPKLAASLRASLGLK